VTQETGLPTLTELEPEVMRGGTFPGPARLGSWPEASLHGGPMVVAVGPRATTSVGGLTDLSRPSPNRKERPELCDETLSELCDETLPIWIGR